jgi:hypothetical protein
MTNHISFRIGPLERNSGPVNAYFVYPGRSGEQVFFGTDDQRVLKEIRTHYSSDGLACEPLLEAAARSLNIPVRELTPEEADKVGLVTFDLALPEAFTRITRPSAITQFGHASARFYDAAPWNGPYASETIDVRVTGSVTATFCGRLLGSSRSAPGLALYRDEDAISKMLNMIERGEPEKTTRMRVLGATFEEAPAFARDGLTRAYGLPKVPLPTNVGASGHESIEDTDLLTLTAALLSVSSLSPSTQRASQGVVVDDLRVTATVSIDLRQER